MDLARLIVATQLMAAHGAKNIVSRSSSNEEFALIGSKVRAIVNISVTGGNRRSLFDLWVLSDKRRPHYPVALILRDVRGADNDHRSIR